MSKLSKIFCSLANRFNDDPAQYGRIDNVLNYDKQFLVETQKQRPDITLKQFLDEMDKMDACMKRGKSCVIKNGMVYEGEDILLEELNKEVL